MLFLLLDEPNCWWFTSVLCIQGQKVGLRFSNRVWIVPSVDSGWCTRRFSSSLSPILLLSSSGGMKLDILDYRIISLLLFFSSQNISRETLFFAGEEKCIRLMVVVRNLEFVTSNRRTWSFPSVSFFIVF